MARPPRADSDVTRAKILRAATHLFASQGEGKTSMRQVAREAGVAQATVHHYYESKDGLYDACFQAMVVDLAQLIQRLREHLEDSSPLAHRVQGAVRAAYRFAGEHRASTRLMNRQILEAGAGSHGSRQDLLFSFIHAATPSLLPESRLNRTQLNIALYGLTCLLVRISVAEPQELARVIPGVPKHALEEHLGDLAVRMLGC